MDGWTGVTETCFKILVCGFKMHTFEDMNDVKLFVIRLSVIMTYIELKHTTCFPFVLFYSHLDSIKSANKSP